MPLLCVLGWHRPRSDARWNNGYYFTRCARCASDLVRTAYGRWHEPRGYRVVWQAQPPPNAVSAELVRERTAAAEADELPIQEVLRHLQNGDAETAAPVAPPAAEPPAPEEAQAAAPEPSSAARAGGRPATRIPDFMGETTRQSNWETRPRSYRLKSAPSAVPQAADPPDADAGPARPGIFERLSTAFDRGLAHARQSALGLFSSIAGFFERLASQPTPAATDEPTAPEAPAGADSAEPEPAPRIRFALFAALAIALAVLVATLWQAGGGSPAPSGTEAENNLRIPVRGQSAFVTASLLNCRTAPAMEAETVGTLMRGDPVELLARDGEWVSLVIEGGQCWAQARYFSVAQPL